MKTPICDFLEEYTSENRLRLHIPGHKGEFAHDITEIYGADSLYESDSGIIGQSERTAAGIFGAAKTCYSCGGSTLAIQTALALLKARGCRTIAAPRSAHRSLVSAAALLRLDIKWLYPKEYMSADVSYDAHSLKNADALFVTNIDYYGGTWKFIKPDIPLVVDNAHGAYLKFVDKHKFGTEYLHPLELGFPLMSAESAHKTLPVLTGGAYLHFAKGTDHSRAKEMMAAFGSSSPSYLILESLDRFNGIIAADLNCVNRACESVAALKTDLRAAGVPLVKSDHLRVCINTRACGYDGNAYAELLRQNGVECEMSDANRVVLLFSSVTSEEDCERTDIALKLMPIKKPLPPVKYPVIKPHADMPVYEALFKPSKRVLANNAAGEVCAELCAPCPPGVPIIMPGEIIDHNAADALKAFGVKTVAVLDRSRR